MNNSLASKRLTRAEQVADLADRMKQRIERCGSGDEYGFWTDLATTTEGGRKALAALRAQCSLQYGDRVLLGDIVDVHEDGRRLIVHHFNGEPWPVQPDAELVEVLRRPA